MTINLQKSRLARGVLWVIALCGGWIGGKFAVEAFHQNQQETAVREAKGAIDKIREDAVKKHPELLESEAMRQEALELSRKTLEGKADMSDRRRAAAQQFFGAYFLNARSRPEFCREQGIDISPFVSAYKNEHAKEVARAWQFAQVQTGEDQYYELVKSVLVGFVAKDMRDIATAQGTTLKGACQLFVENSEQIAKALHMSVANPTLYAALMEP